MPEIFNAHLRNTLLGLLSGSGIKITPKSIIEEFERQKERNVSRKLISIVEDIVRHDPVAHQIYKCEFVVNIQETVPIECLKRLLEAYEQHRKRPRSLANQIVQATIHENDEFSKPTAVAKVTVPRSTMQSDTILAQLTINDTSEITSNSVPEIMQKVKRAATEGLSKSALINNTSHETVANQTNIQTDFGRKHSRWFFNKAALESLPVSLQAQNCAALPISNQEDIIIEDLLYCLTASPGTYIKPDISPEAENGFGPIQFKVSDQIDASLRDIVQDILPLASHYSIVQKFTQWSSFIDNQVLQALSEALQAILNDYFVSVVQLEQEYMNNALNVHKLLYLVRPNLQTMEILVEIVTKIVRSDLTSGKILSLLFDEITLQTGDSKAQQMLIELTERASVPYIEMLEIWILKGVIIDVYNQFFVVDHGKEMDNLQRQHMETDDTARYWECRYTIHPDRIPRFLENDADIILRTGKYLNVIRQCGKQITMANDAAHLEFSPTSHAHSTFIKNAYHNASKTLLELLVNENNLLNHITSVKRYFLLQQGDLITQFMDASEEELSKHVDKVAPVRLDNLLQLIVRLSSAKHDPCLEHLHCDLFTMDLAKQMSKIHVAGGGGNYDDIGFDACDDSSINLDLSGLDCFVFKYNVQWPVSIVLNQWALSQYQMLFRLLFYCKHVERQLCKVWIENTGISKSSPNVKDLWRCAFSLRQRMLNAIQHLEYYMMIEVIEPNWNIFIDKMKTVHNVDEVMSIHQDFLHVCLQNCMLNYPELLRAVMNICRVCLSFCSFIQNDSTVQVSVKWQKSVDEFGKEFLKYIVELLQGIGNMSAESTTGSKLLNLVSRINFNGFYNDEIEQNLANNNISSH